MAHAPVPRDRGSIPERRAGLTCLAFRRFRRGTLIGFGTFHIPTCRLKLFDCAVHQKGSARWVQLPAKPRLDAARELVRGRDGKPEYTPLLDFDTPEIRRAFSAAAVAALESYDPRAFDDDPEGQP